MSSTFFIPSHSPSRVRPPASPQRPLDRIGDLLLRAGEKVRRGVVIEEELHQARRLLESLPLTTDEFGLACNRLVNAFRYAKSGESGAANWELVTLRKSLFRAA